MIFQTTTERFRPKGLPFLRHVGKSVNSVLGKKLHGCEIVEKTFCFCGVLISILLLDSTFTVVKRDARFYNRYVNGAQVVN